MSIHVILGKPGSGKSRFATGKAVKALRESNRNFVTSVPIRPERLNEYVQKMWPDENLEVPRRLRILQDWEVPFFWKFRSADDVGPPELEELYRGTVKKLNKAGGWDEVPISDDRREHLIKTLDLWAKTPTTSDNGAGVEYFLDEAHIAFNARAWTRIASAALFYLSQHRKLGDRVWPITQSAGNLDKQFRSLAEDYTVLRNEYVAKYGIFKGRGRFTWKTYSVEPSPGSRMEPFAQGAFELDPDGIASCYDTAKGIGVHGSKADIGRRAKGIPIMWTIPLGIAVASLCGVVPWALGKGAGAYVGGKKKGEIQQKGSALAKEHGAPEGVGHPASVVATTTVDEHATVSGVMVSGGRLLVATFGGSWSEVIGRMNNGDVVLADGSICRRKDVMKGGGVSSVLPNKDESQRIEAPAAQPVRVGG